MLDRKATNFGWITVQQRGFSQSPAHDSQQSLQQIVGRISVQLGLYGGLPIFSNAFEYCLHYFRVTAKEVAILNRKEAVFLA